MRLGLVGDIHGNSQALAAVLRAADRKKVEALCVAGDFVGYYYRPAEVLRLLEDWVTYRVRGNHEDMLIRARVDPVELTKLELRYGSGLRVALETLTDEEIDALTRLPATLKFELGDCTILLAHGSPWDTDKYIYPDAPEADFARVLSHGADVTILGHTHYRMMKKIDHHIIINPGSAGQPRDRIPGAPWAFLDTATRECCHFTEEYDVASVVSEARERDPTLLYLREVLARI